MAKTTTHKGHSGKNKGHIALYFPKWHYTIATTQKRHTRQPNAKIKG